MLYYVDENFKDFEKLTGRFIVSGTDYPVLLQNAKQFPEKIAGIIYDGSLAKVTDIPGANLEIVLRRPRIPELYEHLFRFPAGRVGFSISDPELIPDAVAALGSFPFEVDCAHLIENLDTATLQTTLKTFLHKENNKAVIQPFELILRAFLHSAEMNLWNVLRFNFNEVGAIQEGKAGYRNPDGSFRVLGRYESGKITYNDAYRELHKAFSNFQSSSRCIRCHYYFACRGAAHHLYGRCTNWHALFTALQETSKALFAQFGDRLQQKQGEQ